jgi:hypothetical protein
VLLLKAVQAKNEAAPDEEPGKLLVAMLRRFKQHEHAKDLDCIDHVDKSKSKSERWQRNAVRMAQLCAEFEANLREDASGEWFTPEEYRVPDRIAESTE